MRALVEPTVEEEPNQENPLREANGQKEQVKEGCGAFAFECVEFVQDENPKAAIERAGCESDSGAGQSEGPDAWFGRAAQPIAILERPRKPPCSRRL